MAIMVKTRPQRKLLTVNLLQGLTLMNLFLKMHTKHKKKQYYSCANSEDPTARVGYAFAQSDQALHCFQYDHASCTVPIDFSYKS